MAVPAKGSSPELASDGLATVVVPALDEVQHIEACLRSVLGQEHSELEVFVVDGGSTDGTLEVVSALADEDPRVRLLHNPAGIIPVALNLALHRARGAWLVRVDAHSVIPPDYVGRAVERLRDGTYAGVGGRKDGVGETAAGRAIAAAMGSRFGVGNSLYHYGNEETEVDHVPFGAYRVDVARRLGGWDETLRVNQDFEFDYRLRVAGHRLLLDPGLVIRWHCRQSVPDFYRQYHRYGRGKALVIRKHPSSVRTRHLAAPALVALLVAAALVAPRRPRLASTLLAPYAAATVTAAAVTSRRVPGGRERSWLIPAFLAMHLGWGVGFWRGVTDVVRAGRAGPYGDIGGRHVQPRAVDRRDLDVRGVDLRDVDPRDVDLRTAGLRHTAPPARA